MKMNGSNLEKQLHQMERLIEVGRKLNTTYELEPLLQTIIEVASELVSCQDSSILLYNKTQETLEFAAVPPFYKKSLKEISIPIDKSIAGKVFLSNQAVFVNDAENNDALYRSKDKLLGFKTRNMLAVPLRFKETTIGVLSSVNKLNNKLFTNVDLDILDVLASQAAIAIENVQLLVNSQQAYNDLVEFDQVKSDFVAITSHELRTPLGLILGHATYLKDLIPEDLKPQMDVIFRSSVQLKGIVEDLSKVNITATGQAKIKRKNFDVCKVLKNVTRSLNNEIENKKISIKVDIPNEAVMLFGDEEKITIAINHLVRNAILFSSDDDSITIRAAKLPGFIQVEIEDTGIGIPENELIKIFDRFYQIESHMTRHHGGMGLGLSVAKMMVEMHNGRLGVHSEEGKGSTFQIMLPISKVNQT